MNAGAIADLIRRVAETQAENFRAAVADVRKELEAHIDQAKRNAEELVAQRDVEIKALEDLLVEERHKRASETAELKSLFAKRLKESDDARAELERKHSDEIASLRDAAKDRSGLEALEKQLDTLKTELATSREASEAADAEIRESVEAVTTLGKSLAEAAEGHKAELATVAKSLAELPEMPELPVELLGLADAVKGMVDALSEKVDTIEKMASGCMRFEGTWDEGGDYGLGATVACKNSLWVAMRDKDLGTPGDRDSGWQMCIKSGKLVTPYEHR